MNTTSPTTEQIEELFSTVEEAIIDFALATLRGDHAQHWHALRIAPDGSTYTSTEVSACYSESEYYQKVPHTLTLISQAGDCFSPDATTGWRWAENADGSRIGNFANAQYEVVENLDEDELAERLAAGWKRFALDLDDWCGDLPDADQVADGWRKKCQAWIDAGNFIAG